MSLTIYRDRSRGRQQFDGQRPGFQCSNYRLFLRLLGVFALSCLLFSLLLGSPFVAILSSNIIFCLHVAFLFRSRYRLLFLVQPAILVFASQLFDTPFLMLGDGPSYYKTVAQYVDFTTLSFQGERLVSGLTILGFLKYASLGVAPIYVVPEFIYGNPSDAVYYLWQGTFHVILCSIIFTIACAWRVLPERYLFVMALFSIVAPSFFDLGSAPTRHIVTYSGVLLTFLSYAALVKNISLGRVLGLVIGVILILISKAPLLIGVLLFVFIDQVGIFGVRFDLRRMLMLVLGLLGLFVAGDYFLESIEAYRATEATGAATFSGYTQLPVVGYVVKYIYALLSPFPWSDAPIFIEGNYGGNWLLFVLHMLSSFTGVYLFLIVIFRAKKIFSCDPELTRTLLYGLAMSVSILKGSTGFHTYLLIYFPFLAPLLLYKEFRLSVLAPFWVILPLEAFMIFAK